MFDLALKATERSACSPLGFLDLFPASTVRLLLLSTILWNVLLFKAVIEHVQETKPYGWDEAFDHFVMDVIQALLSLRRDIAYPMSRMVKGDKMVSRLSVFSTAFLFRILQFWSGFPLSRSWLAIASGVMFGELIGFLSSPLIFDIIIIAFFCNTLSLCRCE